MLSLIIILAILAYITFIIIRLGIHQRLPLALSKISLEQIPDRAAEKYGDKILFTTDRSVSWNIPALKDKYPDSLKWSATRIRSTAGYIAKMLQDKFDIKRSDRVAILKENHFDIHIFILSVVRAGGIACPLNGKFNSINVGQYLSNIDADVLITDSNTLLRVISETEDLGPVKKIIIAENHGSAERLRQHHIIKGFLFRHSDTRLTSIEDALVYIYQEAAAVIRKEDEPLYFVHSSGTTGFPKAVVLRNGAQSHAVRGWLCYVHVSRTRDKGYLAVPNNHQAVILSFNSMLLMGLPGHWTSAYDRDGFDTEKVIHELADGRYTGFFGFPITYTQLKEVSLDQYNLSRMRFWGTTADASHEAIIRPFIRVGSVFKSLYLPFKGSIFLDAQGSSEVGTPSVIRYISQFTKKFDRRIGKPGSTPFGPSIRITKNNVVQAMMDGEAGRLEVKGKTVFNSYWNNPGLTKLSFNDGWFFTGDIARFNRNGHLIQLDREVDVIHTNAGPVYSLPMEEKIHKHPAIFDACVYGASQEDGSQLPAIAVALRKKIKIGSEELKRELNLLLSSDEQLCHCDIMEWSEFPMGITGKTLKRVFRERSKEKFSSQKKSSLLFMVE